MKRLLSLLITILLFCCFALPAYAEDTAPAAEGTAAEDTSPATDSATDTAPATDTAATDAAPADGASAETGTAPETAAPANERNSCVVVGANLSPEQIAAVYEIFGITRGSVPELTVTNAEERKYLEGLVSEAVIGHNSISCVYVQVLEPGKGIEVSTHNISWCLPDMYKSAIETAGISDARIMVAAPFEVSGTAALTGVYKAYEHITGNELNADAKQVSTEELTLTGELSDLIGSEDAAAVIREVKAILEETGKMSDEELRSTVKQIAAQYDLVLNESELNRIVRWCRNLEKLNIDNIVENVGKIQETVGKVNQVRDGVVNFAAKVHNFFVRLSGYIDTIKSWFGK